MSKFRPCRGCRTPFAVVNGGQRYCRNCQGKRTAQAEDHQLRARYDATFAALPAERQLAHCLVLFAGLIHALQQQAAAIHPEELPAENQDAIDTQFVALMKGIAL